MTRGNIFLQRTLISCAVKSYLTCRMNRMISNLRVFPELKRLFFPDAGNQIDMFNCSQLTKSHSRQKNKNCLKSSETVRNFSNGWGGDGGKRQRFPVKLMDFPERSMPNFMKSFRNRFFAFLIRGYYDATFTLDGFLEGATQAAVRVSGLISEGNFAELKGLVVEEAVQEIQNNYADLNYQQRKWLQINPSDIIGKFVYEIGMMFDDDTEQRFVEITVVMHGYHDLEAADVGMTDLYNHVGDNPEKFYVCNYRFIREFTKGVEDSWTINKLNHFLPFAPPEDSDHM